MALTKVTRGGITADAVDGTKIADDAVDSEHYAATSVDNAHINDLAASKLTGTIATARLGSGTASSSTILYGDQTYKTEPAGFDPDAAVVFNDSGADVDFRVESDSVTHALFVDGATGNVGVGDSDPSDAKLSVDGVLAGDVGLRIVNAQATDGLAIDQNGDGYALNIDSESTSLCTARINGKMPIIATQDISGGYAALFTRILDEAGSSPLVEIKDDHVSNTQTALKVRQDGTGLCADFVGDKIRAGEGILFGTDTADANALDDYEEGSWTPTYDGNSLTNEGTYRKIGKLVYVSTTLTNPPSTATFSTITGLPFSGSGWLHHGRSIGSDIDMNDHTYMAATTSINITKNSDGGGVSMTLLAALARIDIFGVYNAT